MTPAVNGHTPTEEPVAKPAMWPVLMLSALMEDRVPQRLGQDAATMMLALIERQDRIWRNPVAREKKTPVGLYIGQLCEMCGLPVKNTERARAARKLLIDDGWLQCEVPKNGERTEARYRPILKSVLRVLVDDPSENGCVTTAETVDGIHLTVNETRLGEAATPAKTVASPQRFPSRHPSENRLPSYPVLTNPVLTDPILNAPSIPPLIPPDGEESVNERFDSTDFDESDNFVLESIPQKPKTLSHQAEAIYKLYPKKVGKISAIKAIIVALKSVSYEHLMDRTRAYSESTKQWADENKKWIPDPERWYGKGKWDDDPSVWDRNKPVDPLAGLKAFLDDDSPAFQSRAATQADLDAINNHTMSLEDFARCN
jgi:hypothetical protein